MTRRQLSTYIDPDANPADRKLARVLDRETARKRSLSRVIYDALLDHFGIVPEAGKVPVLPGMENVYPGTIVAQREGLATVRVGDRRIFSASLLPARTRVFVSIRAHSISIQTSPPAPGSSMRNTLPARVRRVVGLDEIAYVDLLAGSLSMRAMITPTSVRELDITSGKEVSMVFKALSVKLTPR
jgi:molybdopterin-binding protein